MSHERTAAPSLKCDASTAVLLVIDVQERLGDAMPGKVLNRVLSNATLLAHSAGLLGVPVLKTEQYPAGLGPTLPAISSSLPDGAESFEKVSFSCCGADGFAAALERTGAQQVVLTGMEAHVCVLQTALDLIAAGFEVFATEDAICSRRLENYQNALERMRVSGVGIVSAESVVFEWLGSAAHPKFKAVQQLLR